jgi:multiple sugar transport system permease protein
LTALVSLLAGYGFGRFKFRGQALVFFFILLTLMLPFQAMLTPLFLELHAVHLTNSLLGLILLYTSFNLPFGVFLMRNSFHAIPQEIEESAIVDGASVWKVLVRVLRPFVAPGVATTLIYSFLFSWTEFLAAVTFLTSPSQFTLPVALLNVETGTFGSVNYGFLEAGAVIAMVPCVVLYVFLQRYYVEGLASGAVKG